MLIIPLNSVASQTLSVTLANQLCTINVYQKTTGLYIDLYVSDALIIGGVLCRNAIALVRGDYFAFIGNLTFLDVSGAGLDPTYTGLGSQFVLAYLSSSEA